jgi:tetratricopeptide (TPR) repeat protein
VPELSQSPPSLVPWIVGILGLAVLACQQRPVDRCQELVAVKSYKEAAAVCLAAFEATGDPAAGEAAARAHYSEGHKDEVLKLLERLRGTPAEGKVLILAGDMEREPADRERAKARYERALKLAQAAGDHRDTAQAAYRLFYKAWEETDNRRAVRFALTAFQEAEEARDSDMQVRAATALYSALLGVGDLQGAGRALDRAMELHGDKEDASLATMLLNLGNLRLEEGRIALARDAFNRALKVGGEGQNARFYRSVHFNLVEASLALGDLAAAERNLTAAERHAEPGLSQGVPLYFRSCVEHARGREESALAAIRKALEQDSPPGLAWRFFLQQGAIQEALGDRRKAEASYAKAAEIVEEMRSALGIDELKATLFDTRRKPLEALFRLQAEDGRFREALATAERATARSFLDAFINATSTRPDEPAENWRAMAAVDRAEALKTLLPALSQSPAVAPRPIGSVLEALGDRHALLFFEAADRFWRIAAGKSRVEIVPLAGSAEEVRRLVDELLARPGDRPPAEALGQRLLSAASLPAPEEPLFLVPDGVLGQVPFAALRIGGRYLVEDHPIVYLPSLSALAATDGRPAPPSGPAVVLGDPRGDLPAAAREAREVAARLGSVSRTGKDVTREVLDQAAGASVLHLATHTGIGPRGPWLTLADGDVGPGFLLTRRIRPRLVTLATCASAARRGRGLWGSLAATFLAAGSPDVLASLWSVEDEPARRFVFHFYDEGGVRDPAAALARTQRAAIAAGEPPSAWAPYVLVATR